MSSSRIGVGFVPVLAAALAAGPLPAGEPYRNATGLIARWKLEGDARDDGAGGLHGKSRGAELGAPGSDGRPGGAARFDGRGAFIEVPHAAALELGTGDFSIALWIHTEGELDDALGDIASKYDPGSRTGFVLGLKTSTGVTASQSNHRTVHFGIDRRSEPVWTDRGRPGNAVYVCALAVHDGRLYAGTCEPGEKEAGRVYVHEHGDRWIGRGPGDYLHGSLRDVRLYSRALSDAEIEVLARSP